MTPALGSSLVYAASDGRHRPASHPVLGGARSTDDPPPCPAYLDGWTIQAMRVRAGLTQREVAQALGVGRKAVANWEHDRSGPDQEHRLALWALLR